MDDSDADNTAQARFNAFLERVIETGDIWALEHPEGWATAPSSEDDDSDVIPFWSSEEGAQAAATDEWAEYIPAPIPMDAFLEHWLPGMDADGLLAGVEWTPDLEGVEMPPLELQILLEDRIGELD